MLGKLVKKYYNIQIMPFVSRDELDGLQAQNKALAAELSQFAEMRPHLELATTIRDQIISLLDESPEMSSAEIGEVAYGMVLEEKIHEAKDEVAARYEQEHRRSLYERLLTEVEETEGAEIDESIRIQVETDPDLSLELRDSARRELAARALDVVRGEVTQEQQAVINKEAERQIKLDRLDVALAFNGKLNIASEGVVSLLEPGDRVELFFETKTKERKRMVLKWVEDVNGRLGWILPKSNLSIFDAGNYSTKLGANLFVVVGVEDADMLAGSTSFQPNLLRIGEPIVFSQRSGKKTKVFYPRYAKRSTTYYRETEPVILLGTDFQTKDLKFYGEQKSEIA